MTKSIAKNKQVIPQHLMDFMQLGKSENVFSFDDMSNHERITAASNGVKLELVGSLYAGFSLAGVKDNMAHGEYLAALKEVGINARNARNYINLALFAKSIPKKHWPMLASLDKSKIYLMLDWGKSEIKTFCEGGEVKGITYDDASESSVRDLKQQIKDSDDEAAKLKEEVEKQKHEIENKKKEIKLLKKSKSGLGNLSDWPEQIIKVRLESSALSDKALLCVDDLYQQLEDLRSDAEFEGLDESEYLAGGTTLYHNVRAIWAKTTHLMSELQNHFGEENLTDLAELPMLSEKEHQAALNNRAFIFQEHSSEKDFREFTHDKNMRESGKKTRGAPKKNPKKKTSKKKA